MLRRRTKKPFERLNLVPILDAVFIFIFFLLMSAQFLDVYEIGSDVPSIKTINQEQQNDRPPLNLILEINAQNIILKTGMDEKVYLQLARTPANTATEQEVFKKLHQALIGLKNRHPKESTIIFRPNRQVNYRDLVKIMDVVRNRSEMTAEAKEQLLPLFNQIVYET